MYHSVFDTNHSPYEVTHSFQAFQAGIPYKNSVLSRSDNCLHELLYADDPIECESDTTTSPLLTRAVPTLYFDWENVDWMPTPHGQSRIPTPWVGQGSLVGTYDWEIVNDYKAFDGWELLYSTFDPTHPARLSTPISCFITNIGESCAYIST